MFPAKKKTQLRSVVRTRRLSSVTCLLWLSLLCCSKFKRRKAMDSISVSLTVFFDGQFYVGLVERTQNDMLTCCRIVFGAEPKDCEVYRYLLDSWYVLHSVPRLCRTDFHSPHQSQTHAAHSSTAALSARRRGANRSRRSDCSGNKTKSNAASKAKRKNRRNSRPHFSCGSRKKEESTAGTESRRFSQSLMYFKGCGAVFLRFNPVAARLRSHPIPPAACV